MSDSSGPFAESSVTFVYLEGNSDLTDNDTSKPSRFTYSKSKYTSVGDPTEPATVPTHTDSTA